MSGDRGVELRLYEVRWGGGLYWGCIDVVLGLDEGLN